MSVVAKRPPLFMRISPLKFVDTLSRAPVHSDRTMRRKANKMEPARPSATPLKNSASTDVAGGGEPPYDGGMEHRMTALETRFDTILPTLATKADMDSLRAEIEGLRLEIKADIDTLRLSTKADIDTLRLSTKADMNALRLSTKADMDALRLSTKADTETLRLATRAEFDGIRTELEKMGLRMDAKISDLRADMHEMHAAIKTWMLATVVSMTGIMLTAVIAISQINKAPAVSNPVQPAPVVAPQNPR
jgi:hypothetical protein